MGLENITMPQLGESVTEGTIGKWLVQVGDTVKKYDPLAEVTTDKVNAEIPSSFTGVVKEIIAGEGETLAVGELVCVIETEGEGGGSAEATPATKPASKEEATNVPAASGDDSMKRRYSPAVLRMAQENDIDLEQVNGSGKGGRITRKDILAVIESGNIPKAGDAKPASQAASSSQPETTQAPAPSAPKAQPVNVPTMPGDVEIPVTNVRKAIASNMLRSKHEIPHAWMMIEVDVTDLVAYRNTIKGDFKKKEGYNITFLPFFIKAIVEALKEYPQINSTWQGDKIIQKKDINISMAAATEDSLYVPVIKHADEKSIKGIARDVNDLALKVRTGKLAADDMQGGTFTVNNTGSFGSVASMGIINYPQAAILQVESIVKKPVYLENGMFGPRDMVNLCLSLDHRVLDGLICGKFLARVKAILEGMNKDTISIY
ncbi:branched-chain alpha-keto acid dehydrogenase subunit E2 [Lottiidibacillus patelloidae]|uniref:Dihydrolipoamide acetyltransferase component of pyruvate dehydrogenase complex n=1 Tax=Lottiidibacillus patelloidae TaxID=2670334 RepID=A0A263BVM7_9BACI|nr:dihydrolipoamide acetyltransferase family protein [Lottiidibacillus patelloidae]OZM57602.1 branched-chain alpha-keto acid dehydrogenase subunit E2 [Lottiidibacillus patelloidae]